MPELERSVVFLPAWDRTNEGWGVHCSEIRWYVKGPDGAIQFVVYTGWDLEMLTSILPMKKPANGPMAADLGYHSYTPREESVLDQECCAVLGGKPCYYTGSTLAAEKPFRILIAGGGDALWGYLEGCYYEAFIGDEA